MKMTSILAASLTVACVATITSDVGVTYVAPEAPEMRVLALLPVTAGEGVEGFRRLTADSLFQALTRTHPELEIVPADESLRRLNQAGLVSTYAGLIQDYADTGILDQRGLQQLSDVLGADHLMHVQVGYGETSEVTMGLVTDYAEQERQRLRVVARIWSPAVGDVVWEASGTAESVSGELTTRRTIPEILSVIIQQLARQVPYPHDPTPPPPQSPPQPPVARKNQPPI